MTSKAVTLPAKPESKCFRSFFTFSKESQAIKAVFSLEGFLLNARLV